LEERPHLFVLGHWENPDPKNREWRVPRSDVEARVAEVMGRFDVAELACDPPGWHREIEEWGDLYSALTAMFPHNRRSLMSEACDRFESAVKSQGLSHDGNPHLARHLGNAVVKEFPLPGSASGAGRYVTKDHPDSPRKIDLAVAAIVAHYRAGQTISGSYYYEWPDEVAA
jgi:phage terminase large subunit-like protein